MRLQEHWLPTRIDSAFQLWFREWGEFLHNEHLTAALLDRITVNRAVVNMKDCISIRPKNIPRATSKQVTAQAHDSSS